MKKKMFDQQLFPPILLFKFFFPTLFFQVLHQHNDTLSRLEAASSSAYGYALGITGKSLSEALLFAEHGENMLCTEIVLNVRNNFCTQHVLPMF